MGRWALFLAAGAGVFVSGGIYHAVKPQMGVVAAGLCAAGAMFLVQALAASLIAPKAAFYRRLAYAGGVTAPAALGVALGTLISTLSLQEAAPLARMAAVLSACLIGAGLGAALNSRGLFARAQSQNPRNGTEP